MRFFHHHFRGPHALHAGRFGRGHHHGFFGFDHHFGGFHGGRGGPGGMGPGRKLSSADLQLLLLALLEKKASHGYELIKALDERSSGYYSPSPGMIYPALTYLEEIGFATVHSEGTKKLYSITELGRAHLEENRTAVDTLLAQLSRIGERMAHLRRSFAGEPPNGWQGQEPAGEAGPDTGRSGADPALKVARYDLSLALEAKAGAPAEEQQRIAAVLQRAAAEIRGR
jgi:DNA-binding PadR family transcriptional regulator